MDNHVGQMMCACVQLKKLAVDLMGNPRQGMPIAGFTMKRCECPEKITLTESSRDMRITNNIGWIVVEREIEPNYWEEDQ